MKKIGVVLFGNKSLEVREFPNLEPGLNEVLIEVKAAGICGSDLHFYRSSPDELGVRCGKIVGHEPAGIVIQTGNAVSKFKVGDRVTVNHTHVVVTANIVIKKKLSSAQLGKGWP